MNQRRMPPGMMPPPGTGGVPLIGGGPPPADGKAAPPSFADVNPLPPGPQALKTLRGAADCAITKEAEAFKQIIPKIQLMKVDVTEILETYGQGVATIIGTDNYCSKQLSTRTVVTFAEDATLDKIHTDLQAAVMEMQEKMADLTALKQKIETLASARWDRAVKEVGLSPDKRFYQIDEEAGLIRQLDLKCVECKGATRIRKLRQEMMDKMVHLEFVQKEEGKKDDGTRTNDNGDGAPVKDANADRKEVVSKQEVPVVVDTTASDGVDGGDGSSNST